MPATREVKVGDLAIDDRGVVGRVEASARVPAVLPITDPMSLVGFPVRSAAPWVVNGDGSGGLVAVGVDPGHPPVVVSLCCLGP